MVATMKLFLNPSARVARVTDFYKCSESFQILMSHPCQFFFLQHLALAHHHSTYRTIFCTMILIRMTQDTRTEDYCSS